MMAVAYDDCSDGAIPLVYTRDGGMHIHWKPDFCVLSRKTGFMESIFFQMKKSLLCP